MLPNEDRVIAGVKQTLGPQLEYARKSLFEALVALEHPVNLRFKSIHPAVPDMAIGLHVRLCRKFRQAIALTEVGQADGVEMLCRSMFETALAQAFICRPTVKLRYVNGPAVPLFGQKLTRDFRAQLFIAHTFLREEKRSTKMSEKRGLKRFGAKVKRMGNTVIAAAKAAILLLQKQQSVPIGRRR
jgi:hypothetical protein